MASRDALAVRRQKVIDSRAAAIAALQQQFTELQNQLLCELRRAVGAVEAAEHAAVRPLEAEMDGMVQRVQDIDRLAELTALKVRSEPKHKFVEYARLLQQARRQGPLVSILFDSMRHALTAQRALAASGPGSGDGGASAGLRLPCDGSGDADA